MARNPRRALAIVYDPVDVILRLHFQHSPQRKVAEEHSSFYLGLNDVPIDLVAEVWVRLKKRRTLCRWNHSLAPQLLDHIAQWSDSSSSAGGLLVNMRGSLDGYCRFLPAPQS